MYATIYCANLHRNWFICDLGVLLNSDMSMDAHLTRLVSSCFGVLRQICCIRRSLPRETLSMLVTSFIASKIDNCKVALAGLPQRDFDRIQFVLNTAARLTADARKFDHVTSLLVNLQWLRVPERIQYKLCVLVHRCLNGAAPQYLSELIQPLSDVDSRRRLRSASTAEVLALNQWWPWSCRRRSTCLEQSSSRSAPIRDISRHTWSHICSTYHSLQFDCITDYFFVQSPWSRSCCIRLSEFIIIILHYMRVLLNAAMETLVTMCLYWMQSVRRTVSSRERCWNSADHSYRRGRRSISNSTRTGSNSTRRVETGK